MPSDATLYLYTSLTAGSSHIITATSRIETILKANKIPFKALDCATDDKARMLWARRSKGRKIPGLVKFNDVIADLEQVEEWNEYGELEEQIDEQIDIFGDVPISATSAEAQATAAARLQAQEEAKKSALAGTGRTASETRHISISEPKDTKEKEKKDSPLSMAMRQAGTEAAAKAGQKKTAAPSTTAATAVPSASTPEKKDTSKPLDTAKSVLPPPTVPASASVPAKLDLDAIDPTTPETTGAKTPNQLAAEGVSKLGVEKINATSTPLSTSADDKEGSTHSTPAQIIEQRRKLSVPVAPSSLAKSTSIDQAHTIKTKTDTKAAKTAAGESNATSQPITNPSAKQVAATDTDDDEEEEEDEEEEDDDDDDDDDDDESEEEEVKERPTKAAKISATSKEEEKVLKGTRPQNAAAKDASQAGVSVAD